MAKKGHLILGNAPVNIKNFDPNRAFAPNVEISEDVPPEYYTAQKQRFLNSLQIFQDRRAEKIQRRTLDVPAHIEYVKIDFYTIFKNDANSLKKTFIQKFGLSPVLWRNFNQTVLFAINDNEKFENNFVNLLNQFINSAKTVSPKGKNYAILILIADFEFLTFNEITSGITANTEDINIHLVSGEEILLPYESILNSLNNYLETIVENDNYLYKFIDEKIIEVRNVNPETIRLIVDNFDIIHKVSSGRVPVVKPNKFSLDIGADITWGINIENDDNAPLVGVIDTGVRKIEPLADIIVEELGIDKTSSTVNGATIDSQGHGTMVASLVAIGIDFFDTTKTEFVTAARIVPIKILHNDTGETRIADIESAIREAANNGVRIFNLSVNSNIKNYNQEHSEYAYLLDKLSYELDIIVIVSAGNLDFSDAQWLQDTIAELTVTGEDYSLLEYPNYFYNPHRTLDPYNCEVINLQEPAESLNNITVGALADNLDPDNDSYGLAFSKYSPAFYSRKFYFDYSKKINGTKFTRTQTNYNIFKPDIVMPGGDYIEERAGMKVLSIRTDFYVLTAGTSLSAPLATNIVAKIAKLYPTLSPQSIKAILINSSNLTIESTLFSSLIDQIKRDEAAVRFPGENYNSLNRAQKMLLSQLFNQDTLMSYVSGHGRPNEEECLFSSDRKVTMIVQDSIAINTYKGIKIAIPKELLASARKSYIIKIKATICYSFPPILNNQLSYNPLHISFTLYRTVDGNNQTNTEILSSQKDHEFYEYNTIPDNLEPLEISKQKDKLKSEKIGIKAQHKPWSEDVYPYKSKPFSNVQKIDININKEELQKVDGNITLLVRATAKTEDIDSDVSNNLQNNSHAFSIALSFEEFANDLGNFSLYNSISAINLVENIINLDTDLTADIEL